MQIEQTELLMAVFGAFDENIKQIERELNVSVISRGTELKITGEDEGVSIAARAITALLAMAGRGESIGTQTVQYVIGLAKDGRESEVHTMSRDVLCITAKGKPVKAKTLGQKKYMEAIRQNGFDKETINNCYVTDRDRTLIGAVSLRALVLSKDPDNELIRDMMDDNVVSVSTTTDQEDVSQMFEKYGYLAIPVVDNEKRLVGIVTIDDAISIMQDEASEDIAKMNAMGPSDKPYFKQSMWELYKNRAPWLLFLMISSTFSSMVIRGYEDALAAVTVLTAYIPMLTDAGGNAGSQSTSTIIRGMAVGDIEPHDLPKILWREFRVAILCGGTLALCNFAKLIFLDGIAPPVAAVVCLTLICTVILSQLIGGLLPVAAEKLNFDPAVMASPLITTIVDTTTLLIYFNIARVLLKI